MPLDARKTLHILQAVGLTFAGRQRTVVLVTLVNNSYGYSTLQAVMRPMHITDPQIYDSAGQVDPHIADTLMIAPLSTNFTGVVYIADTPSATATAVATAPKYELVESVPTGIVPGGTHLHVALRRLR